MDNVYPCHYSCENMINKYWQEQLNLTALWHVNENQSNKQHALAKHGRTFAFRSFGSISQLPNYAQVSKPVCGGHSKTWAEKKESQVNAISTTNTSGDRSIRIKDTVICSLWSRRHERGCCTSRGKVALMPLKGTERGLIICFIVDNPPPPFFLHQQMVTLQAVSFACPTL